MGDNRILAVKVVEARSLAPSDVNGWADPFATVLCQGKKIGKTEYVTRTLNPQWNETFFYKKATTDQTLRIEIADHDTLLGNDILGTKELELCAFSDGKWSDIWYRLESKDFKEDKKYVRGYVRLQIQFVSDESSAFDPADHNTQVEVEAENLRRKAKEDALESRRQLAGKHQEMSRNAEQHNQQFMQNQQFNKEQRKIDKSYVPGQAPPTGMMGPQGMEYQQQQGVMPPGMMQPGQPGMMQPGQPGMMQPGQPGQPGMGQPGMMQPGMGQPGMMQPGMGQPGMMQPGMMQPGMGQPGMMQPGMGQPGMMQPGMMQPGMGQPGMYPGMMQPGMGQPTMGPGMGQPTMGPGMGQPTMGPGMGQPTMGPGMGQPTMGPGMGQPNMGPGMGQ